MEAARTMAGALTERLRDDIVTGALPPGSRLKLSGLGQRYEAGLIPLREALARLADKGFVTLEEQKGFRVTPVSREDLLDLVGTRIAIECLALRQSVELGGVEWEARVVSALHRLGRTRTYTSESKRRVTPEWDAAHDEYHEALVGACNSPRLMQYRIELAEQIRRYRFLSISYASTPREVGREHDNIVAAAIGRDADQLCRLMAAHFNKTADIILSSTVFDEK